MAMTFRPVAEDDVPQLCDFPRNEDELFWFFPKAEFPLEPAQLKEAIAQRSDSMVVDLDGRLAGFANFYQWEFGGCCRIGNVIVSPVIRGRGVGSYLVRQMVELAFAKYEASEVIVACFHENVEGLLLYSKLGFQPFAVEERKDKRGKRLALIHMRQGH